MKTKTKIQILITLSTIMLTFIVFGSVNKLPFKYDEEDAYCDDCEVSSSADCIVAIAENCSCTTSCPLHYYRCLCTETSAQIPQNWYVNGNCVWASATCPNVPDYNCPGGFYTEQGSIFGESWCYNQWWHCQESGAYEPLYTTGTICTNVFYFVP